LWGGPNAFFVYGGFDDILSPRVRIGPRKERQLLVRSERFSPKISGRSGLDFRSPSRFRYDKSSERHVAKYLSNTLLIRENRQVRCLGLRRGLPMSMTLARCSLFTWKSRSQRQFVIALILLVWLGTRQTSVAQDTRYPKPEYFFALQAFHEGEFVDAAKGFKSAARSGLRSIEGPWIDGICYHTMAGECFYQMGDPARALEQYTAALNIFVGQNSWLVTIQFPPSVAALNVPGPPINWGKKSRRSLIGNFPEWAQSGMGRLDNADVIARGGVVQQARLVSVNINEVARCIAVSLRRRAELLGPVAPHDPLTSQLVSVLTSRPGPPNHWSQAWVDCWLGLAYLGSNRPSDAISALQNSLLADGQYDHPLTAIALLELGKLTFRQQQYDKAATFFLEATYPATIFQQYDIVEEAFRYGSLTELVAGGGNGYAPLAPAITWSNQRETRFLQVSLMLEAAEHASRTDVKAAAALLENARRAMLRRAMSAGALGGRFSYLSANVNYLAGKMQDGDAAFAQAMAYYQKSSLWLFQILMADKVAGSLTEHGANELYAEVLREPRPADWAWHPAETFAVITAPAVGPWEHWFELAVRRDNVEEALDIADRVRRKQFYAATPIGGRLLALRWVLEAPKEALNDVALQQRQTLLQKYPLLAELADQSKTIREKLDAESTIPVDAEATARQQELLGQLARVSAQQEVLLRPLAVGREPCEFAFPPLVSAKEIVQRLPEKQAALVFFSTSRDAFGFLLARGKMPTGWRISAGGRFRTGIGALLKELGNFDGNSALNQKNLDDKAWKATARTLFQMVFNLKADSDENPLADFEEVVIVPHGVLWYLPFEVLRPGPVDSEPLISTTRIRYAPLLSLAIPDKRLLAPTADTILIAGKLHPQEPDDIAEKITEEFSAAIPGMQRLTKATAPTPLLATLCDRLLVYTDIDATRVGPFGWQPMPVDEQAVDGSVGAWMALPWGAPQQIILPGFHTRADSSLKKGANGDEIFLTVCGLMASGSRSILISRWRVGGNSTQMLVREYLQELPHQTPSSAWQRSVLLLRNEELDTSAEPRLNATTFREAIKGDFPFFWGGYMLVDPGTAK